MSKRYLTGCSGFFYRDWRGRFYPEDLPQTDWLGYYAQTFHTVEINNSFYRLPTDAAVADWYGKVPADFQFTLKGSRYTTHMKQLKEPQDSVARFYHMADGLREKLACVLWQLPERMAVNLPKLEHFCATLQPRYRNVIEFRHSSWWEEPEVQDIMRRSAVAFCILSAPAGLPDTMVETADFAYVRFHGTGRRWYHYNYSDEELQAWARRIRQLKARTVYIYFNNDVNAHAVANARTLDRLLNGPS